MLDLQKELGMGLMLITHDLGVVAQTAQRVIVMYAARRSRRPMSTRCSPARGIPIRGAHGLDPACRRRMPARCAARRNSRTVPSLTKLPAGCAFAPRCSLAIDRCREQYPPLQDWAAPSGRLLACRGNGEPAMTETRALLEITDLVKHYPVRSGVLRRSVGTVHAVDGVSFSLSVGERSALSRIRLRQIDVARSVLRLVEPTSGSIRIDGETSRVSARRAASAPALNADRVPGSVRFAQSA